MGAITRSRLKKTSYSGSACGGSDGSVGRTLTHTRSLLSDSLIIVGRSTLHETDDYSVSGTTITFDNVAIMDSDKIMVYA